jgi:hypothetical protein
MTDKNNEDAQKQLEMMQKLLDDAARLLGNIHSELKDRKAAQKKKEDEEGGKKSDAE